MSEVRLLTVVIYYDTHPVWQAPNTHIRADKAYLKPFAKIYTSLLRGLDAFGFLIITFVK